MVAFSELDAEEMLKMCKALQAIDKNWPGYGEFFTFDLSLVNAKWKLRQAWYGSPAYWQKEHRTVMLGAMEMLSHRIKEGVER